MAMIQCPECSQVIPDTATICPHCGTPIFVCPSCGNVSSGQKKICNRCGYGMSKQEQSNSDTASKDVTSVINQWLQANPNEIKNRRIQDNIQSVCSILALALLIIGYFVFVRPWKNIAEVTDPETILGMSLSYESDIRYIWIIVIAGSCFWIADTLIEIYQKSWPIRCANWLNRQNVDMVQILKKESFDLITSPDGLSIECDLHVSDAEVRHLYYRMLRKNEGCDTTYLIDIACRIFHALFFVSLYLFLAYFSCSSIQDAVISGEWSYFRGKSFWDVLGSPWVITILIMVIGRILTTILKKANDKKITNYLMSLAR